MPISSSCGCCRSARRRRCRAGNASPPDRRARSSSTSCRAFRLRLSAPSQRCSERRADRRCPAGRDASGRRRRRCRRDPDRTSRSDPGCRHRGPTDRNRAAGKSNRSRRPASILHTTFRPQTSRSAVRRCRRRTSARETFPAPSQTPVPSGMAAVSATIFSSFSINSHKRVAKNCGVGRRFGRRLDRPCRFSDRKARSRASGSNPSPPAGSLCLWSSARER